jgi:hypothetical protein
MRMQMLLNVSCSSIDPLQTYRTLTVRRVHWLRARAQLMRWKEEVTLTGYEMQWTVRYFQYQSQKWVKLSGTGTITGIGTVTHTGIDTVTTTGTGTGTSRGISTGNEQCFERSAGVLAYSKRQEAVWQDVMRKADQIFGGLNLAYQSPL